jgi:hypothetical protein
VSVLIDKHTRRTQYKHGSELPRTCNIREIQVSRKLCNNEVTARDECCDNSTHIAQLRENSRQHRNSGTQQRPPKSKILVQLTEKMCQKTQHLSHLKI